MTPGQAVRFPRAAAALDAQGIADTFAKASREIESLIASAHAYEPGSFRRAVREVTLRTLYDAIGLEGDE
jgi:hypothetical protein